MHHFPSFGSQFTLTDEVILDAKTNPVKIIFSMEFSNLNTILSRIEVHDYSTVKEHIRRF